MKTKQKPWNWELVKLYILMLICSGIFILIYYLVKELITHDSKDPYQIFRLISILACMLTAIILGLYFAVKSAKYLKK